LAPYLICAGLVASQAFRSIAIAFPHFKQAGQRESIIVAVPDFPEFTLGSSLSVSLRRTQTRVAAGPLGAAAGFAGRTPR
jgi:hypothetical protein